MIFDKVKKLDIVFDSPEVDCPPVYSSGDVVSGRVHLDLFGEIRVDSLKLHAEGFAKVHWTESRSAGSSTAYTQNYSDEVEYLNRREALLQAGQSALQARWWWWWWWVVGPQWSHWAVNLKGIENNKAVSSEMLRDRNKNKRRLSAADTGVAVCKLTTVLGFKCLSVLYSCAVKLNRD